MNVPCPYCKDTLRRIRPIEENVTGIHKNNPLLEQENGEYFVTCPNCGERVQMDTVPGGPSGTSFSVRPNQMKLTT